MNKKDRVDNLYKRSLNLIDKKNKLGDDDIYFILHNQDSTAISNVMDAIIYNSDLKFGHEHLDTIEDIIEDLEEELIYYRSVNA